MQGEFGSGPFRMPDDVNLQSILLLSQNGTVDSSSRQTCLDSTFTYPQWIFYKNNNIPLSTDLFLWIKGYKRITDHLLPDLMALHSANHCRHRFPAVEPEQPARLVSAFCRHRISTAPRYRFLSFPSMAPAYRPSFW